MVQIPVRRLDPDLPLPSYAHPGDAGADLHAATEVTLQPGERALVPTGIAMALPEGYVGLVHPRSGLAARHGISIVNAPGTIDAGYRGEVQVCLVNTDAAAPFTVHRGDRIAQLVVQQCETATFVESADLADSARGEGGYGSTGGFQMSSSTGGLRVVRFGRKGGSAEPDETDLPEEGGILDLPAVGPFDESQVDVEEYLEKHGGVDLGSIVVVPDDGTEVRLEVDETTGDVGAVILVGDDGALELRAFAASRGGDAWDDLRPQIAAEVARIGGTASEQQGSFGSELVCRVPMQSPDGQGGTQTSRVIGTLGPAWILRATLMGAAALDPALADPWEESIRRVVVRRGRDAMPPGSPLPLRLPPEARRVD